MKIKRVLFSSVLSAALIASICGTSVLADSTTYTAKKAVSAPTIDGNLTESMWAGDFNTYKDTDTNTHLDFKYVWDNNNLYIAGKMQDSNLFYNPKRIYKGEDGASDDALDSWAYDDFEINFSPDINQADDGYGENDVQFMWLYQPDGKPDFRVGSYTDGCAQKDNYAAGKYNSIKSACAKTSDGWQIEIAISWSDIGITDFTKTFSIGMLHQNNDPDSSKDYFERVGAANFHSFVGADMLKLSNDPVVSTPASSPASTPASSPASTSPSTPASTSPSTPASTSPSTPASTSPSTPASTPAASTPSSTDNSTPTSTLSSTSDTTSTTAPVQNGTTSTTGTTTENTTTSGNPNTGYAGIIGLSVFFATASGLVIVGLKHRK